MSTIANVLGFPVENGEGEAVGSLDGIELLSLYFCAFSSPSCQEFTPKLDDCYDKVNADKKRWEVVLISSDRKEKDFDNYYCIMPWLAMPYDIKAARALNQKYGGQEIPKLVFLNPKDGTVITEDGKAMIDSDPTGNKFPWK